MRRRVKSLVAAAVLVPALPGVTGLAGETPAAAAPAAAAGAPTPPASGRADAAALSLAKGINEEAVRAYTEALKDQTLSNDKRASILNDRGVAFMKLGQARPAIEDFNKAAGLFPEYAAIYNNRGNQLLALGLVKEAIKDFDRAIVLAPGFAAAYNNRANAFAKSGQHQDAIQDYTKAIELMPAQPAPLSGRGKAHLALRHPHAAVRDFSRAVNADQRFASAYRNRAEAKLQIEHYDEAIEDLSRALAFNVADAESYVVRGEAYLASRDSTGAMRDFGKALELDPALAPAYTARGLALAMSEMYAEAFADLNRAIELKPKSAQAFATRAFVYKRSGQLDVAAKDVETAEKLDANSAEVHWAKGEIAEAFQQLAEASDSYRKALALKPGFHLALDGLQRLGAGAGDTGDKVVASAGVDAWRVVERKGTFVALNDIYPRLTVPLEMLGEGKPKLLEWEEKEAPYKGIGTLRFFGGEIATRKGKEEIELVAIVDLDEGKVIAIAPHKKGDKIAAWTWDEGKVMVAGTDGVTEEFSLAIRGAAAVAAGLAARPASSRRYTSKQTSISTWAPWNDPLAGGQGAQRPAPRQGSKKKPKTLFDLLFN